MQCIAKLVDLPFSKHCDYVENLWTATCCVKSTFPCEYWYFYLKCEYSSCTACVEYHVRNVLKCFRYLFWCCLFITSVRWQETFCTFTFDTLSTFWCQHFRTFTQVHFEFKTFTCSRVFLHCSIDTFTQVKNLNTFYNTGSGRELQTSLSRGNIIHVTLGDP